MHLVATMLNSPIMKTPFSLIDSAALHYPAPNATMVSLPHPGQVYYSARPFPGLRIIALNTVISPTIESCLKGLSFEEISAGLIATYKAGNGVENGSVVN
jgi:hypothetical protein